jgi:hypothetical protein
VSLCIFVPYLLPLHQHSGVIHPNTANTDTQVIILSSNLT